MFTRKAWFGSQIGDAEIESYLAGGNFDFEELGRWIDNRRAIVVLAFISKFYRHEWTEREGKKNFPEQMRRRFIFVPVMMDYDAKAWWDDFRQRNQLSVLPNQFSDYYYTDFTDEYGQRQEIADSDEVQAKIAKLARAIRVALFPPDPVSTARRRGDRIIR
jgi:hypothetical protein